MDYQELIERLRKEVISPFDLGPVAEAIESLLAENERLKLLEESALKVCSELDNIVMVMPYDYLNPPDGGNVPMSEQISRMWSEVKTLRENVACVADLRAELAKYRDAPCVAYATTNEEDDLTMLFFDEDEARKYSGDDEPIKLIVKPGENK